MLAKSIRPTLTAAALFVLLCIAVAAQSDKAGASSSTQLEGTWEVKVDLINPPPFMPEEFTALETYSRGGGMVTSNDVPFLTRVGQGAWKGAGGQYLVKIKFFTFDPGGLPSGTLSVTHAITLDGKDDYTGKGTAVLCAPDGTTCATVHFETTGRRLAAQP
jgi:hypothetical protein